MIDHTPGANQPITAKDTQEIDGRYIIDRPHQHADKLIE